MDTPATSDRAADPAGGAYSDLRAREHPDCIACSPTHAAGFHLDYECHPDGSVETRFDCRRACTGYSGRVHGGIVALLLDSAMTHCLFARNCSGYTARLAVRYRRPVRTDETAVIRAHVERQAHGLYRVSAELEQDQTVCATGRATFVARPACPDHSGTPPGGDA